MICHDFRRELTQQQCIDELTSTFGEEATSKTTIHHWFRIQYWRRSPKHEFKENRSKSVVVTETLLAN